MRPERPNGMNAERNTYAIILYQIFTNFAIGFSKKTKKA